MVTHATTQQHGHPAGRRCLCRALLAAILLTGPALMASAGDTAITVTDDRGKTLALASPAVRPAAISTFGADLTRALGMVPVAVTNYGLEGSPEFLGPELAAVPSLGPRHQPSLERLSAINPDLILAIRRYTEKDSDQLEAIAPMLAMDLITLDDSLRAVAVAGEALGQAPKARQLNQRFLQRMEQLANQTPQQLRVAILTSAGQTPFIYYDHFIAAAIVERLGLDNVGGSPPNPDSGIPLGYRVSLEALLALDPDIILLLPSNRRRAFTDNPVWPYLTAVRNARVYEVRQYWKEGAGPIARMKIVDDIEALLAGTLSAGVAP